MNLLFWNLYKKENSKYIEKILLEKNIDIAIFSEFSETDFKKALNKLKTYTYHAGYGGCEKIILIAKKDIAIDVIFEQSRYVLYSIDYDSEKFLVAGIHLPSNPASNSNDRKDVIFDLVNDIKTHENKLKNYKTIVIGDYNCSPFDEELIQKNCFNSVLFKSVIKKQEYITYNNKKFRRFYNPILDFLSNISDNKGSYYYSANSSSLYWYCYDQIIVRKSLMDRINNFEYCKKIGNQKLLKEVAPNKDISDHLPLYVEIRKGVNDE